jgi:hypothetical protein
MYGWTKRLLVFVMVIALVCTTAGSSALAQDSRIKDEPGGDAMIADFVLVRPLGIAATAVGTAFWVVSLPFSALGKNTGTAWNKLVKDPFVFTFARPLGQFD